MLRGFPSRTGAVVTTRTVPRDSAVIDIDLRPVAGDMAAVAVGGRLDMLGRLAGRGARYDSWCRFR